MKKFVILFFLVFFFSFFASWVSAEVGSFATRFEGSEHIRNFQTTIKVNKDGTIDVREEIIYDFGSLERHGIFRTIPFTKTNKAGKKFRLDFSNVSVTDENGLSYQYKKTEPGETMHFKIGDPDKTTTGSHTYVISYKVSGALTYFSDHDELYWNVTGNDWNVPIAFAQSTVELPTEVDESGVKIICYTGFRGSKEQNCSSHVLGFQAISSAKGSLNSNEGFTTVVSFPKNLVAVLEPKPYLTFWETTVGKITIVLIGLMALFWYLVYPLKIAYQWYRYGRDPLSRGTGQTRAWFDPPKTSSGRILTPEEAGALLDEVADKEDVSAMIVSLAQRGYFKIVEKKKREFTFVKRKEFGGADLLTLEKEFLKGAFEGKNELVLKKSKLYKEIADAKNKIYEKLVTDGFFPKNPESIRTFYTVIGILALATGNILLVFASFTFGRHMPKKTVEGVQAANVAKSLKNFLSSQERQLEFQAKNQMMFEKLLPYAIAFGVEKIWADRFKDVQMQPPDWYQGYGMSSYNAGAWVSSMNSSFSSVNSASMSPTSSSSGFSSGSSGGSSGGGGGGGGGGSW